MDYIEAYFEAYYVKERHSGRVLDLGSNGCLFEIHWRRCVVSFQMSNTLYPLLSAGSTQEDRKIS